MLDSIAAELPPLSTAAQWWGDSRSTSGGVRDDIGLRIHLSGGLLRGAVARTLQEETVFEETWFFSVSTGFRCSSFHL